MTEHRDVAVVGTGLAGLSLARRLASLGVDVGLVEARDRVGGRTLTREVAGAPFDLGGQWVSPAQGRVMDLCRELGVETHPQHHEGAKIFDCGGQLRRYRGDLPAMSLASLLRVEVALRRLDSMTRRVPLDDPARAVAAERWDGATVEGFARTMLGHRDAREAFDAAVRTIFGAEPAEMSLLYFLFYLNSAGGFRTLVDVEGGAQERRLVGGAQQLAEGLARRFEGQITFGAPAQRIEQDDEGVTVHTGAHEVRARQVVLAIPPHLAARIAFDPPLSSRRAQLLRRWVVGSTVKLVATYARASWREAGLSGEAVCTRGPLSCVFDATPHGGSPPALVAFVVGRDARRWGSSPAAERRETALSELERLLGAPAADVEAYVEQDWATERWSGGCPVASLPTGVITAFTDVWRSREGRIHWAGTETARHWNGYIEGALESAERVASDVLGRL